MNIAKNASLSIVVLMLVSVLAVGFSPSSIAYDHVMENLYFDGGDGTVGNPYQIGDVTQLQNMNANLTAHYVLVNDIDASETSGWNGGAGFETLGTIDNLFNGSLDGNNFTISDLFIYRNETDYVGLFGYVEDAEIKNFGLTNVDITGADFTGSLFGRGDGTFYNLYSTGEVSGGHHVGGLIGFFSGIGSTLSDSHTTVDTTASSYNVGGLVGRKSYGNIERCHASGDVSGTTSIGGFLGTNSGETVRYSYSTGDVSGRDSVGGFVGSTSSNGNIFNSYSTGTVTRTEFSQISIAGFCGRNYQSKIIDSYSTGAVYWQDNTQPNDNGFLGTVDTGGNYEMTGNFWDVDTSGQTGTAGNATGKNITEMMTRSNFTDAGWDFTDNWWMVDGETRPFLQMEWSTEISNSHQLQLMAMDLTADYTLVQDINLTDYITEASRMWGTNSTQGGGFVPVGNDTVGGFTGSLDGQNHTITGLYLNRPDGSYIGLFGRINSGGSVFNIYLEDADIAGRLYAGGIVGYNSGTISNCEFDGTVEISTSYVGGITGINFGTISNCITIGTIIGNRAGGIAGRNDNTIIDCHSLMTVQGGSWLGGIAGENFGGGDIRHSSASGDISSGGDYAGGLVGHSASFIESSHATGDVSSNGNNAGGLVGYSTGSIESSYATGYVNSNGNFAGGLVGRNEGGMVNNSHASGNTTGEEWIGGLIGYNNDGELTNSSASGDVIGLGNNYAGGLVGYNNLGSIIINSFAEGNTTGHNYVGGLAGYNHDGTVTDSYAKGIIEGNQWVGGLVGYNDGSTVSNSHSISVVNATDNVGGLVGLNTGDISDSYSSGTANGTGAIGGLVGQNTDTGYIDNSNSSSNLITVSDFGGGLVGFNAGLVNGSHATGNVRGSNAGGLIGNNKEGTVNHSYATGRVEEGTYAGGLIGHNWKGLVNDSYATGYVNSDYNAGGLVGYNWKGTVNNSYATGDVSGGSGVGGFIGHNNGNVSRSYTTGDVSGEGAVGGFVGLNTGNVSNSYAWGSITRKTGVGNTNLGGFVGFLDKGRVTNSYSIGSVSYIEGDDPIDSGFAGATDPEGHTNMTGNYWDVQTSLQTSTAGNATGEDSRDMMQQSTFTSWDFDDIWGIHEGTTYPFLRVFGIPAVPEADLEITLDATLDLAQLDGTLTYEIAVYNHGPDTGTGVDVNVTIPVGTSYISSSHPFDVNGRDLFLEAANIANGDTLEISLDVSVNDYGTGEINCTASVTTSSNDLGVYPNEDWVVTELNHPPEITTEDVTIATVDTLYSVDYNATDQDDTDLTWSLDTDAEWLSINETGTLSGTTPESATGTFQVNVSVSDGRGGSDWSQFTLEINNPPTITTDSLWYGSVGELYTRQVEADDPNSDPLIWGIQTDADWLSMNSTGYLSGTPTEGGIYWVNISVDDGRGGSDWKNLTIDVNASPEIHTTALPDGIVNVGYGYQLEASDPDEEDIYWSMETNATHLNSDARWLDLNSTGYLSGTPDDSGEFWVNITVSDNRGGSTWRNYTLTVVSDDFVSHELVVNVDGDGSVNLDPDMTEYPEGTEVTLTAQPATGWVFVEWTGDATGTDMEITITMDSDLTITAHFQESEAEFEITNFVVDPTEGDEPLTVHITAEIENIGDAEGTIILGTTDELFNSWTIGPGDTATVDETYTFEEVGLYYVNLGDESITVNVGEVTTFDLEVSTEGEGSVDIDPELEKYEEGSFVTLTAEPSEGWEFLEWQGTDETGMEINLTMDENKTIIAVFQEEIVGPIIEIDDLEDGTVLDTDSVSITWTSEEGTYSISHYEIRLNGNDWEDIGMALDYTFEDLDDGEYTVDVKVVDVDGQEDIVSIDFTVDTEEDDVTSDDDGSSFLDPMILGLLFLVIAIILTSIFFVMKRKSMKSSQSLEEDRLDENDATDGEETGEEEADGEETGEEETGEEETGEEETGEEETGEEETGEEETGEETGDETIAGEERWERKNPGRTKITRDE